MSGEAPPVAVVILNWNGLRDTIPCVESVIASESPPIPIVVVDNGSTGDDAGAIAARFGDAVHVVRSATNLGFAGGNNLGIRHARESLGARAVVLLNNDTIVRPGFARALLDAAEANPDAGLVASVMHYHDPPDRIWYAGGWSHAFGFHGHSRRERRTNGEPYPTGFAPLASVLLTPEALRRVGLLSEAYFFLWEDLDYCASLKRAGLRIMVAPRSRILHKVGASSKGEWAYRKLWHGMRGRVTFRRRHLGRAGFALYLALFLLLYAPLHAAYYVLVLRDPKRVPAMAGGVLSALKGTPPPERAGGRA